MSLPPRLSNRLLATFLVLALLSVCPVAPMFACGIAPDPLQQYIKSDVVISARGLGRDTLVTDPDRVSSRVVVLRRWKGTVADTLRIESGPPSCLSVTFRESVEYLIYATSRNGKLRSRSNTVGMHTTHLSESAIRLFEEIEQLGLDSLLAQEPFEGLLLLLQSPNPATRLRAASIANRYLSDRGPASFRTHVRIDTRTDSKRLDTYLRRALLSDDAAEAANAALLIPNDDLWIRHLQQALAREHAEPSVRAAAVRALIDHPDITDWQNLLLVALQDSSVAVRDAAASGFNRFEHRPGVYEHPGILSRLADAFWRSLNANPENVADRVIQSLSLLGRHIGFDPCGLIDHDNPRVHKKAVRYVSSRLSSRPRTFRPWPDEAAMIDDLIPMMLASDRAGNRHRAVRCLNSNAKHVARFEHFLLMAARDTTYLARRDVARAILKHRKFMSFAPETIPTLVTLFREVEMWGALMYLVTPEQRARFEAFATRQKPSER